MPRLNNPTMRLVRNIDDCMDMKRWLGERREVLGLDTETSGLDPWASDAKLRLIQVGDHNTGWAIPWEQWGGAAMEVLNNWDGPITLHNAAFDAKWLKIHAKWDMPWHRTHDTMIMAQIERPGGRNDLKHLSTQFVDPMSDAGQKDLKDAMSANNWGWGDVPVDLDAYWVYSALDPILAAHLYTHFRTDKSYAETYDLEMAVRRICTNMEMKGMRIDVEYSQKKYDELTQRVEKAKAWAKDAWGISIGSNIQLANFFANTLGAEFTKFSAQSSNPSVDKEQLGLFLLDPDPKISGVAKFILDIRNSDKMANSYFKNFVNMNHDGIVHPSIKTMGARTGRMSVTDPALQTIPSKDSSVRNAFIPYNEGEKLLASDYSQVELRLMAHFSRDPDLIEAFREADRTGGDFFANMGRQMYNDPSFGKKDPRRKLVKGTMYGMIYGAGTQKMADTAGITYEEMAPVVDAVRTAFPGIEQFMKETEEIGTARENGPDKVAYIETETGRRIPADRGRVYSLVNYTLQGNAAELMKKAVARLDAAGYGDYMQMVIHDEVVLSMPEDMIHDAKPEIAEIMSYTDGHFAVDLLAEPEGPFDRWGSKYADAPE